MSITEALIDEDGRLYGLTDDGLLGEVHAQDMLLASDTLSAQISLARNIRRDHLPQLFGYIRSPAALLQK